MLGAFAALLITVGLLFIALRLLGRLHGSSARRASAGTLQVLERVATGPRQGVVLLRAANRVFVVGMGDSHATLLGELDGSDRELAMPAPQVVAGGANAWRAALSRVGLMVALAIVPMAVHAQVITAPKPMVQHSGRGGGVAMPTVTGPGAPQVEMRMGSGKDELKLSGTVGIVVMMGAMTLLPAMFMLMTGFTRILIVLSFLRTALGTQQAPPTQLLVAIAVILTSVVMRPVLDQANRDALQPYLRGEITQVDAYKAAVKPLRHFMLANTRQRDLATFVEVSGSSDAASIDDVPTTTVVAAFAASELRTAFQMGFLIFLPFLVIDLIVSSVLMSMGMFMLPPVMVSLPFKLLLFVLANGWALVMQNLVMSFRVTA